MCTLSLPASTMLKYLTYECPFCGHLMPRDEIVDFNDKYFKCTSGYCDVMYIPRDAIVRRKLCDILREQQAKETTCAKCSERYVSDCVLHTEQFSVCPHCSFNNSYSEDVQFDSRRHFHGGSGRYGDFPRCEDCDRYYDNYKYNIYEYGHDLDPDYQQFVCGECLSDHPDFVQSYYDGDGAPCSLPEIEEYPKIELTSELHKLSLFYLPVCSV